MQQLLDEGRLQEEPGSETVADPHAAPESSVKALYAKPAHRLARSVAGAPSHTADLAQAAGHPSRRLADARDRPCGLLREA